MTNWHLMQQFLMCAERTLQVKCFMLFTRCRGGGSLAQAVSEVYSETEASIIVFKPRQVYPAYLVESALGRLVVHIFRGAPKEPRKSSKSYAHQRCPPWVEGTAVTAAQPERIQRVWQTF